MAGDLAGRVFPLDSAPLEPPKILVAGYPGDVQAFAVFYNASVGMGPSSHIA